jgi:hypothetical protein
MGVELDVSHKKKIKDRWCWKTGCSGEYLDLRRRKWGMHKIGSFIT